jgi:hypothetical protein
MKRSSTIGMPSGRRPHDAFSTRRTGVAELKPVLLQVDALEQKAFLFCAS